MEFGTISINSFRISWFSLITNNIHTIPLQKNIVFLIIKGVEIETKQDSCGGFAWSNHDKKNKAFHETYQLTFF